MLLVELTLNAFGPYHQRETIDLKIAVVCFSIALNAGSTNLNDSFRLVWQWGKGRKFGKVDVFQANYCPCAF